MFLVELNNTIHVIDFGFESSYLFSEISILNYKLVKENLTDEKDMEFWWWRFLSKKIQVKISLKMIHFQMTLPSSGKLLLLHSNYKYCFNNLIMICDNKQ